MQLSSKKMIQENLLLEDFNETDHLIFVIPTQHSVKNDFEVEKNFETHWQSVKSKVAPQDFYVGVSDTDSEQDWLDFLVKKQ